MFFAAYKLKLVDNIGDKRENIVKRDACWVKNLGNYKELSEVNKNSGSEENEQDDIEE